MDHGMSAEVMKNNLRRPPQTSAAEGICGGVYKTLKGLYKYNLRSLLPDAGPPHPLAQRGG